MKNFRISYLHNSVSKSKIRYNCPVAQIGFETVDEAMKWVADNPKYTPLRLLEWCDDIDCFAVIKNFQEG